MTYRYVDRPLFPQTDNPAQWEEFWNKYLSRAQEEEAIDLVKFEQYTQAYISFRKEVVIVVYIGLMILGLILRIQKFMGKPIENQFS